MERIGTDTLHFLCRLALPLGELPPQAAERAFAASTLSVFALLRHLSQRERLSEEPVNYPFSPKALPLGELARQRLRGQASLNSALVL